MAQLYFKLATASFSLSFLLLFTNVLHAQRVENMYFNNTDTIALLMEIKQAETIRINSPDSAREICLSALKMSQAIRFKTGLRQTYYLLGMIDYRQNRFPSALSYFRKMLPYCDSTHKKELFYGHYISGHILQEQSQLTKAMEAYSKALQFGTDTLAKEKCGIYYNMAEVFRQSNQLHKALHYYNLSLDTGIGLPAERLSIYYAGRGHLYINLNVPRLAELDLDRALYYAKKSNNYTEQVWTLGYKVKLYRNKGQNNQALMAIRQAERIVEMTPDIEPLVLTNLYIIAGDIYTEMSQYHDAVAYYHKAKINEEHRGATDRFNYTVIIHKLSDLYFKTGRYKDAYTLHMTAHNFLDSTRTIEVDQAINEIEIRYRTAEKDKLIVEKQLKLKEQEEHLLRQKAGILLGTSLALLIISILGARYFYSRQKNRRLLIEQEVVRLKARIEGEEEERARLSHELHDGINSQLTALHSYMLMVQQTHPHLTESEVYDKMKKVLAHTATDVRHIAHNLAPDELRCNGLLFTLQEFCYTLFASGNTRATVIDQGNIDSLPMDLSLALYRITQEWLQNIKKHAEATEVTLCIKKEAHQVSLDIEDNGKGMPQAAKGTTKVSGIGLTGIKDRVEALQGQWTITPRDGGGTEIHISFPTGKGNKGAAG